MARWRASLGLLAGILLLLSSAAHSILGWKGISRQLAAAGTPPDLLLGLKVGWQFGGLAMLVLGAIVVWLFAGRLRGQALSTLPALVIGAGYVAFGAWTLLTIDLSPFFFIVFLVPGILLVLAAAGR
jgi:hypothetical protein